MQLIEDLKKGTAINSIEQKRRHQSLKEQRSGPLKKQNKAKSTVSLDNPDGVSTVEIRNPSLNTSENETIHSQQQNNSNNEEMITRNATSAHTESPDGENPTTIMALMSAWYQPFQTLESQM